MKNGTAIKMAGLTKVYRLSRQREVAALDSLDLEIKEGEIFGLLGPNGSGKTTAIKLTLGLLFPTSGTVEVFGESSQGVAIKNQIGYLPENPYYYRYLTGPELLAFYGSLFDMEKEKMRERRAKLLQTVGLDKAAHLSLKHYSKGMLERIGLAAALLNDPKLLILDEPTTGLDPIGSREIRGLLLQLRDEGKTILLSSHYLSEVERVSSRVGILHQGKLLDIGELKALMIKWKTDNIEDLFVKVITWSKHS